MDIGCCPCEEPDWKEGDEAIQPLDEKFLTRYDGVMGDRVYYIYIMTNLHNTTLYTGITNNLYRRIQEHKQGTGGKFSKTYKLKKLVYYEVYSDVRAAISSEKQIKGGSRMKKLLLIESLNSEWCDLALEMFP